MKRILFFFVSLIFLQQSLTAQNNFPYKDSTLPVDERVKDLLSRMTPEEKFWQCFMIPGDLDNRTDSMYKNGIFGLQVSATAKGDAAGQMLNYNTKENALAACKKNKFHSKFFC